MALLDHVIWKGELVELTPQVRLDMLLHMHQLSGSLSEKELTLIRKKDELKDSQAWVKEYEQTVLSRVAEEKVNEEGGTKLRLRYTNDLTRRAEAVRRLETDEEYRDRLSQCGRLAEEITHLEVEYRRLERDYKTSKLYFEAVVLGRRKED